MRQPNRLSTLYAPGFAPVTASRIKSLWLTEYGSNINMLKTQFRESKVGRFGSIPKLSPAAPIVDLSDAEMRTAQDLLFFAYHGFTAVADQVLEERGLGRAHHRALHFIGCNPGITVAGLLTILRITKQSLARVLSALVDEHLVGQAPGYEDRRLRLLTLTDQGRALERRLFNAQRDRISQAYRTAGLQAVQGFLSVMGAMVDDSAHAYLAGTGPAEDA